MLACCVFLCIICFVQCCTVFWSDVMATSSAIPLSDAERATVVRSLSMLSASMRRAAKVAHSDEVRVIQERDAGQVDALAAKFR